MSEPTAPIPSPAPVLLVTGSVADGFTFYGPFEDSEDAGHHAELAGIGEWWSVDLMTTPLGQGTQSTSVLARTQFVVTVVHRRDETPVTIEEALREHAVGSLLLKATALGTEVIDDNLARDVLDELGYYSEALVESLTDTDDDTDEEN